MHYSTENKFHVEAKSHKTGVLTTRELAKYMKLNEKTILKMAQNEEIPGIKIGNQWRFHVDTIDRHLQQGLARHPENHLDLILSSSNPQIPLSRLFNQNMINLDLKAQNREEVLHKLSRMAFEAGLTENSERLYRELENRESMLSTAAGKGIAIPHPRNPEPSLFRSSKILLGRSADGVDFSAPDNRKVHLFFMICVPDIAIHLKLLAKLSKVLHIPGAIDNFMTISTGRKIIQYLLNLERKDLFAWNTDDKE
ncbi:MAG: PTS sugar transporter subunit IIA [Kiritimatiellia bacterium]